jgi:hypothetical protein
MRNSLKLSNIRSTLLNGRTSVIVLSIDLHSGGLGFKSSPVLHKYYGKRGSSNQRTQFHMDPSIGGEKHNRSIHRERVEDPTPEDNVKMACTNPEHYKWWLWG